MNTVTVIAFLSAVIGAAALLELLVVKRWYPRRGLISCAASVAVVVGVLSVECWMALIEPGSGIPMTTGEVLVNAPLLLIPGFFVGLIAFIPALVVAVLYGKRTRRR